MRNVTFWLVTNVQWPYAHEVMDRVTQYKVNSACLLARSALPASCENTILWGLDLTLLWLWRRLVATAPIQPLSRELLYASGMALKKLKKKKKSWKDHLLLSHQNKTREVLTVPSPLPLGPSSRQSKVILPPYYLFIIHILKLSLLPAWISVHTAFLFPPCLHSSVLAGATVLFLNRKGDGERPSFNVSVLPWPFRGNLGARWTWVSILCPLSSLTSSFPSQVGPGFHAFCLLGCLSPAWLSSWLLVFQDSGITSCVRGASFLAHPVVWVGVSCACLCCSPSILGCDWLLSCFQGERAGEHSLFC